MVRRGGRVSSSHLVDDLAPCSVIGTLLLTADQRRRDGRRAAPVRARQAARALAVRQRQTVSPITTSRFPPTPIPNPWVRIRRYTHSRLPSPRHISSSSAAAPLAHAPLSRCTTPALAHTACARAMSARAHDPGTVCVLCTTIIDSSLTSQHQAIFILQALSRPCYTDLSLSGAHSSTPHVADPIALTDNFVLFISPLK